MAAESVQLRFRPKFGLVQHCVAQLLFYLDVKASHRDALGIKLQFGVELSKRRLPSSLVRDWMSDSDFCVFIFSRQTSETTFPVILEGDFCRQPSKQTFIFTQINLLRKSSFSFFDNKTHFVLRMHNAG